MLLPCCRVPAVSGAAAATALCRFLRSRALLFRSLWCGFAVVGNRERFYFAGDTAYCPIFGQIGERYGPFDLGENEHRFARLRLGLGEWLFSYRNNDLVVLQPHLLSTEGRYRCCAVYYLHTGPALWFFVYYYYCCSPHLPCLIVVRHDCLVCRWAWVSAATWQHART